MSRFFATISSMVLLSTAGAPLPGQALFPAARIDSVFSEMNRSDRPGCSLAIFRAGKTVYSKGYGMANLEYGIALSPRSVFHIASISKQFTAFAVELLVSEGRVSWDDDIREYVPELPDYGSVITLRHLANHTSGIRDQWNLLYMAGWRWQADLVTQGDALDLISRQRALNFEPGDEYLYSNSGFTLLAAVVERVSGLSLREFTQRRIFEPLGMNSTHFHDDHETIVRDRAFGYRYGDQDGWKMSIPDFAIVGASSLFTTVEDMEKWNRNLREHTVGDDAVFASLLTKGALNSSEEITYAHGIIVSAYRGLPTIGHGGSDAGYRSSYLQFPNQDVGIVCFCNFMAANPSAYVREVADIVLQDALAPTAVETEEVDLDLDRWASSFETISGYYRDPMTDIPLTIFVHEGEARVTRGSARPQGSQRLIPLGANLFVLGSESDTVLIEMSDGRPSSLVTGEGRFGYAGKTSERVDRDPYLGIYESDELGTEYRIEADTGAVGLLMTHRKHAPVHLRPAFSDAFNVGGDWIVFHRGQNERITGFTRSSGRVRKLEFAKR